MFEGHLSPCHLWTLHVATCWSFNLEVVILVVKDEVMCTSY